MLYFGIEVTKVIKHFYSEFSEVNIVKYKTMCSMDGEFLCCNAELTKIASNFPKKKKKKKSVHIALYIMQLAGFPLQLSVSLSRREKN